MKQTIEKILKSHFPDTDIKTAVYELCELFNGRLEGRNNLGLTEDVINIINELEEWLALPKSESKYPYAEWVYRKWVKENRNKA